MSAVVAAAAPFDTLTCNRNQGFFCCHDAMIAALSSPMANIREGARRMRMVGNLVIIMAIAAGLVFLVLRNPVALFALGWLPIGGLIWAAGWILDGFAD